MVPNSRTFAVYQKFATKRHGVVDLAIKATQILPSRYSEASDLRQKDQWPKIECFRAPYPILRNPTYRDCQARSG